MWRHALAAWPRCGLWWPMPPSRPRGRPRHDPAGPLRDLRLMLAPATYETLERLSLDADLPLAAYARSLLVGALARLAGQ